MKVRYILSSFFAIFFFACASQPKVEIQQEEEKKEEIPLLTPQREILLSNADVILEQLSTEEKVAQLFIIMPEQLSSDAITKVTASLYSEILRYPVGGFIFFARHIEEPSQLRKFTKKLKEISLVPPILAVDEEGGRVARIAQAENFFLPQFENMATIGATKNIENARGAGQIIGSYLKSFGFTLNFAPVADVNTNPKNIVIGKRAFGSDPEKVADMVGAFLSGLHSTGVKGCIKHFPGHGDTKGDTHSNYVAVKKNWAELKHCELIPFVKNFSEADYVMVAHVTCTNIDTKFPASLSKALISGKLRGELGYKGLILTDALNMGAIEKNYGSDEACILAIEAGNDILLMPKNFHAAYNAVLEAVRSGRISIERIDESVLRILHAKGF